MHTRMRCLWSRGCMCTGGMFERVHVHTLRLYTGIAGFRELDRPSRYQKRVCPVAIAASAGHCPPGGHRKSTPTSDGCREKRKRFFGRIIAGETTTRCKIIALLLRKYQASNNQSVFSFFSFKIVGDCWNVNVQSFMVIPRIRLRYLGRQSFSENCNVG